MAIFKAVNPKKYKAKGITNIVNYVLRKNRDEDAGPDKLIYSGINLEPTLAVKQMNETKQLWDKTKGREYYHFIISFPPDENISIKKAHEVTRLNVLNNPEFNDYECLIATHHDKKNHIDSHIIVNSVSYSTGYKFHYTKRKLAEWKEKMNNLHISLGLKAAPKKGYTYDGKKREEIIANNRNTYEVLQKAMNKVSDSFILNCAVCVLNNSKKSLCKEDFISKMEFDGFSTDWIENHKNIVFSDLKRKNKGEKKYKVRLSRLFEMFNYPIFQKEELENEFERNRRRKENRESELQIGPDTTTAESPGRNDRLSDEKPNKPGIHNKCIKPVQPRIKGDIKQSINSGNNAIEHPDNQPKKRTRGGRSR